MINTFKILCVCFALIFFVGCKKDSPLPTNDTEQAALPKYNCRVKIFRFSDDEGKPSVLTNPLKLIVTDSNNKTVYIDSYNNTKTDLTFPLAIGNYTITITDTTNVYAPYIIKHKVYPPKGGDRNWYSIEITQFPKHKINIVSVVDTVIDVSGRKEKGIYVYLTTPSTTDTVYLYSNYFKSPLSYPIKDPSIISGSFWYTVNGEGKFFFPIADPSHEYIRKGEQYYFSIVSASKYWFLASLTDEGENVKAYNATSKTIYNYKFTN